MGAKYVIQRTGTAISTTADYLTIVAPSTRALRIDEIRVAGGGTASAAAEMLVARSSAGATPSGAITPQPLASGSPAAATTAYTAWTTQPTQGVTIRRVPFNANGAINPVIAKPGNEIEVPPSGMISFRSGLGTSLAALEVVVEEVG